MSDHTSHGWFVLGWQADLHRDPFTAIFTASVREHPSIIAVGSTRSEARCELREKLTGGVGPAPSVVEAVN